jgi:hypothetical protein
MSQNIRVFGTIQDGMEWMDGWMVCGQGKSFHCTGMSARAACLTHVSGE